MANSPSNMHQLTDDWRQQRCGKVTASRIADLMAKTRTGYSASRSNYMAELIAERLTGEPYNNYVNSAMQWGIDHENEARVAYEFIMEETVELVGFIECEDIPMSGASPDGRVGKSGLIEIKCPNTATHIETILSKKIPTKYIKQMQWQMFCDDRGWCDFVSYDPRMPIELQLFRQRLFWDNDLIEEIKLEVIRFISELESKIEILQKAI